MALFRGAPGGHHPAMPIPARDRAPQNRVIPLRHAAAPAASPSQPAPAARAAAKPLVAFLDGEPGTPGSYYRVARPAAAARAAGLDAVTIAPEQVRGQAGAIARAQVLWIWRATLSEPVAAAIEAARRGGARVIFDIDDLMIDSALAVPTVIDGMRTQRQGRAAVARHFDLVRATMAQADLCVASTEELAGHFRRAGQTAIVIPNGFDHAVLAASRQAAGRLPDDGLIRIGYASGSRTHQRDFFVCAEAVGRVLRRYPQARLVVFHSGQHPLLDVREYAELRGLERQVEFRGLRPLAELPEELARFDINLAPLEVGNPFCEAKSELKFFEAAVVDVPTIASPTGPFARAIRDGQTGLIAATRADWTRQLDRLTGDAALRRRLGEAAHRDVLWAHGPERRAQLVAEAVDLVCDKRRASIAFASQAQRARVPRPPPITLPESRMAFAAERHRRAEVTVVVPLHNYAGFIVEALDSAAAQTLGDLDLVVVDDGSRDASLTTALAWAREHAERFGSLAILAHRGNAGLAAARNSGFARAATPWVLTLDADNRLLPECAKRCLYALRNTDLAFVYPALRRFGAETGVFSDRPYDPALLIGANYIDACALIARAAWAAAGGYHANAGSPPGWEDYDFWCRLAELGLRGELAPGGPLAEYRVHEGQMSRAVSGPALHGGIAGAHPWLRLT